MSRRESNRAHKLKSRYGITVAQYDALLSAQDGKCAICEATACKSGRAFAVDHDHACCPGRESCGACVRGLLCANCNRAIGMFNDSPERLEVAAAYLRMGIPSAP